MENNEKQEMQRQKLNLRNFRFKTSKDIENMACNRIVSYFKEKNNETKGSNLLLSSILEQIGEAFMLDYKNENTTETDEHLMLMNTADYLNRIRIVLNTTKENVLESNFEDNIQCLDIIAQNAMEESNGYLIKDRLEYFITEIKKRYNKTK